MRILASIPSLADVADTGDPMAPADSRPVEAVVPRVPRRATVRRSRAPFPGRSIVLLAAVAAATWSLAWWKDRERRAPGPERVAQAPAAAPVTR